MKKMKRILSAAFALILTLVLVTPAFAAGQDTNKSGTITINNAEPGKTYKAYRLFDLSYDGKEHYGYTVNEAWVKFFTEDAEGKALVNIDETNGNVTLKDNTEHGMQNLASKAKSYADRHSIKAVQEYTTQANEKKVIFENLSLGYYMTTTNAGGLYALDTTNPNTEMFEKNTEPTINKSADKTNVAYGTNVHYTIPFTRGGYVWGDYVITDIMTGLDMTDAQIQNIKITVNKENIASGWEKTYTKNTPNVGSNTLKITIPKAILEPYKSGTEFVLEYDAVAKKTVSMDNKVSMHYKNGPDVDKDTPWDEVKVANYEFNVKKIDETGSVLNGAMFELYTDKECTEANIMKFVKDNEKNTYRLAEAGETNVVTTISAGQAKVEGLAAGTYYLKETVAPDGYNKLVKPVKIEIKENLNTNENSKYHKQAFDNDGNRIDPTIVINNENLPDVNGEFILEVVNKTGTELPSTGGIGTTIFYAVGSVLILAAVIVLMIKKRKEH